MQWDTVKSDVRWVRVPTETANKVRRRKEQEQERKARYETSEHGKAVRRKYEEAHPGRDKRSNAAGRLGRPFIIWDGESPQDTGYSLFGCLTPEGYREIMHPWLNSKECLRFIVDVEADYPDAIHCGFGFNLDVSWILRDLPWRALNRLKKFNRCMWNGYQIEHIPHKWFTVKYGKIVAKIFDVHSFFGSKLTVALEDWKIGPWRVNMKSARGDSESTVSVVPKIADIQKMTEQKIVEVFKNLRGDFLWKDIQQIKIYMRLELKYMLVLMEKLREAFDAAGYVPNSWHGPGALATMAMKRHHVFQAMAKSPPQVAHAARCAFFGGRFSLYKCGHIREKVYFADRNSAYPYACTFLPNLAKGRWRYTTKPKDIKQSIREGRFALYRIHYWHRTVDWGTEERDKRVNLHVYPLPRRMRNGNIEFVPKVTGWYWTPEAELVVDDTDAEFVGAWVFEEDDCNDRPFAWVPEYYRRRQLLKRNGQASEKTFKLILNAIFGQCARRTGWDRKKNEAPKSHQLEWAGYITSHCRAAMFKVAQACGEENVVSIDTDGILSLAPIPIDKAGDGLGEWKTHIYSEAIVWQQGMYIMKDGDMWEKPKARGVGFNRKYNPEDLIKAVEDGVTVLPLKVRKFLGYGVALNGQFEKNNTWTDDEFLFIMGGNGSRWHWEKNCQTLCKGGIHQVQLKSFLFIAMGDEGESYPHFLPWAENDQAMWDNVSLMDDITLYDSWDEEEWRENG